jgi:hypothetical protein
MVAAVAISILAAPPAGAGMGSSPMRLTISKTKDGPYSFSALHAKVNAGPKGFFVKVADKTEHRQDGLLEDVSAGAGSANFKIRWFRGDENITSDVQGPGYGFGLKPGKPKVFRALVKPLNPDPGALCLAPRASVEPDAYQAVGSVYINDVGVCG